VKEARVKNPAGLRPMGGRHVAGGPFNTKKKRKGKTKKKNLFV
jgi:hypothetical protein